MLVQCVTMQTGRGQINLDIGENLDTLDDFCKILMEATFHRVLSIFLHKCLYKPLVNNCEVYLMVCLLFIFSLLGVKCLMYHHLVG